MAKPRVGLVVHRTNWAAECLEVLWNGGLEAEIVGRDDAQNLETPVAAISAHVDSQLELWAPILETWAKRGLQPCTALFLAPVRRSALLAERVRQLGYARLHRFAHAECSSTEVHRILGTIVDRELWVAGAVARQLGTTDPVAARVLTCALDANSPAPNVIAWARRCYQDPYLRDVAKIGERHELARCLKELEMPPPGRCLDVLRLCCSLSHAWRNGQPSRAKLARRFGYASADSLGRRAKRLTCRPLGELRRMAPEDLLVQLVDGIQR